ncbi:tail fiber protein, partial [Escherichia coli TW15901]
DEVGSDTGRTGE